MSASTDAVAPPAARSRGKLILYVVIGLAVVAGLILAGRQAGAYVPRFAQWVEGLGVWGPVVFILGYAVATVAFVPGSLLTLAAGAIFGLVEGTIYTLIGATLGASAAFLVARYLARGAIERKIAGNAALRRHRPGGRARGVQDRGAAAPLPGLPVQPAQLRAGADQGPLPADYLAGLDRHAAGHAALRLLRQGGGEPRRRWRAAPRPRRGPATGSSLGVGPRSRPSSSPPSSPAWPARRCARRSIDRPEAPSGEDRHV